MRRILWSIAVLVAGCSSPADEDPVQLQPGLYEVVAGGATLVQLPGGKSIDRLCYSDQDASWFKRAPLARFFPEASGCTSNNAEPRGNALAGSRTCVRDGSADSGPIETRIAYDGHHTTNSFKIEGTVAQGEDETDYAMRLGSGEFTVVGRRVGDC